MYRFVIYEELNGVLKRFQMDVILVYDSYAGSWTVETASFPYNGLAASGSNLYSSYAKVGAVDTEVYLQKLAFDSSYCEDRYNSMFYGEAVNDMVDPTREAFYQSLSSGLAYVRRVVDGDTIVIHGIAGAVDMDITVRFNYINTPESTTFVEPYGMEASYFLKSLYSDLNPDTPIYVEFDSNTTIDRSDRYGRMLAWLWTTIEVEGEWVKDQLIQVLIADRGYIKSYYDFGCVDYVADVEAAVAHAVENKVGLYANLQTEGPYYIRTAQSNDIVGNFQILDTGNRNQDPFMEKRYKEIQIMMSNDSTAVLEFYLEFFIDSIKRRTYSSYSIDQITDINASDYGTIYVVENEDPDIILGNETAMSFWQLDFSVFPELEIVKVVYKITGRGHYPRVVLVSRNENNYRIIDYAWVFRTMNGR
jgi:endonuclease YncB( thermonuclease family)